jgi:hypothetical protein
MHARHIDRHLESREGTKKQTLGERMDPTCGSEPKREVNKPHSKRGPSLPTLMLRKLQTKSILLRRLKIERKEMTMAGSSTKHRARASIMKPLLM